MIESNITKVFVLPDQIANREIPFSYRRVLEKKRKRKRMMPVGILSVYLSEAQYGNCVFIDNYIRRMPTEDLVKWCLAQIGQDRGLICFGGTCLENPQAVEAARIVKQFDPSIVTVYGGPNASSRPEKHQQHFDLVSVGPGFSWDGRPKDMIWPTYKVLQKCGIRVDDYKQSFILTSAGCAYNCRFCASKYVNNRRVQYRDVSEVLAEIEFLRDARLVRHISFRDDIFTFDKNRLQKFCRGMVRLGLRWSCQTRVDHITAPFLKLLKDSGCWALNCGFESINDSTLAYIGKGFNVAQIKESMRLLEHYRMPYSGGFIVGLPNEGKREIQNTLNFIRRLRDKRYSRVPNKPVALLGFPRSELYDEIVSSKLVDYDWHNGELLFPRTRSLTRKQVEELAGL